jgi:tetratricopeptide (TPR) repeat protein
MLKFLVVILFSWALLFFHSCMPGGDQRQLLALSRAENDVIRDYTPSFSTAGLLLSTTKRCGHCNKLVEVHTSEGECMFRELWQEPYHSPRRKDLFKKTRKQLRGEAAAGYGPASFLLGLIAENGLFETKPDIITAARQYRLFAENGGMRGKASLACFWIRMGENLPEALAILQTVIKEEPRDTELHMYISQAYTLLKQHKNAFDTAKKAYYYAPSASAERQNIENIFVEKLLIAANELGEKDALAQINDMIYLSPKNQKLIFVRSQLYAIFGKFKLAEQDLNSLKDQYNKVPLLIARAKLRNAQRDYEGAKQDIKTLMANDPDNFYVRTAMLELLMTNRKTKEAFAAADSFIRKDKDKTAAYLLRANLHAMNRDLKRALADFKTARASATKEDAPAIDDASRTIEQQIIMQE